jgi:hypothetical protein
MPNKILTPPHPRLQRGCFSLAFVTQIHNRYKMVTSRPSTYPIIPKKELLIAQLAAVRAAD